jgi:AraC-like DNA-binding protein
VASSVRYSHVESLVDVRRQLINSAAGAATTQSVSGGVRQLGRALEDLAPHEPRAAFLLLLSTAEELRQAIGGTDEDKALLESTLADPDASLHDVLVSIEAALMTMIERRPAQPSTSERIRTILDIIERRYVEPLKIGDLAAHVCRGRAHVASQFRRETGSTIHRYLTQVRMRHAAELLQVGEKVEAVMLLVGYKSKKSFYSHFRAHTGQTPGCFRRRPCEFNPRTVCMGDLSTE